MNRPRTLLLSIVVGGLTATASAQLEPAETAGAVAIVLPPRLVAGQAGTLAVLAADGRLLPDVAVELSSGMKLTTDATGRAVFAAPAAPGALLAKILCRSEMANSPTPARSLSAADGLKPCSIAEAATIVIARSPAARIRVTQVPKLISLHDRFVVRGTGFQGQADWNHVQLNARPAVVLAASPVSLLILGGPGTVPGPTLLSVEGGGNEASALTTLVAVEAGPQREPIAPKEKTRLVLRVRGTVEPLSLEVRNLTPDVVRFHRGELQRVKTSGGVDNSVEIEMQGRRAGDFSFRVRIVPPPTEPADVEAAREYLKGARPLAPPREARSLDKLIRRLERRRPNLRSVREILEAMLEERSDMDFRRLLEAAREALTSR